MKSRNSVFPNLSAELTRNNYTYSEFAGMLGTSIAAFSNKMNGKVPFVYDEIKKTIAIFNLDFNYLFEKRK